MLGLSKTVWQTNMVYVYKNKNKPFILKADIKLCCGILRIKYVGKGREWCRDIAVFFLFNDFSVPLGA